MKKLTFFLLALLLTTISVKADEGMWMLPLIQKLNIQKMQGLGLTMTADQIYSDKNTSLKDAVIIFGNGCTGVMVSPTGLVFTNHHCGYSAIQQLSSVAHNYLKDGFTAKEITDELPCPGLSVTYLIKIEDVTTRVVEHIGNLTGKQRETALNEITETIKKEAKTDPNYTAQVRSFYSENEYYLFVYEKYNDVRLACTPPASIGKFGGETDNWMYPRHTGDFSVFRVYADKNGKPAEYSENNIPYTPKRYAAVSNKGFSEGDYAMILGNPGSTDRYATSYAIKNRVKNGNSARIEMRGVKQNAWQKFMRTDEAINLAYANKFAGSANYWKNSIGMNNAIKKLNVISEKEKAEAEFTKWINSDPKRGEKYGNVLPELKKGYETIDKNQHAIEYLRESLLAGVELPRIASNALSRINTKLPADSNLAKVSSLYKDYYPEVDKSAFTNLLEAYRKSVSTGALPEVYKIIDKKFKGNYENFTNDLFRKSVFTSQDKLVKALKNSKYNFSKDPAVIFSKDILSTMTALQTPEYKKAQESIADNKRLYEAGLKEWSTEKNKPMYPDANFTMRLTYGQILGYKPADAIDYRYYTTTKGILEKEDAANPEFIVPEKLKNAIMKGDYGRYIDTKTGKMQVAFISTNDITGGNSGSPVFNAKGEVIGLAFDGNWEAMSGDIIFEPNLQRTISVDIRYVLFIMEKIGGADRLIKELNIK
ncbi:MAG: S46 family peptidase [Paludibacteraceae bacterium]